MGLADRDYMRERAHYRAGARRAVHEPQSTPPERMTILAVLGVVAVIAVMIAVYAYRRDGGHPLMGPMKVTTTGGETTPTDAQAPGAAGQSVSFPASGTIEWGPAGEPIGGDLQRLDIWDVTRSRQSKVIHIRSGPETTFAIIYLAAGERTTLMVPAGKAYRVTAASGDDWRGPSERFGPTGTTVDFGMVGVWTNTPGAIAMGAADQTANVIPNEGF